MLKQIAQVACELEAIEGTAETLEGADVFLVFNPKFEPSIEPHKRDPVRSVLSPYPSVFGKRSAKISFDVEMTGTAAAGSTIHFSDALKACGVSETLVALTSATYKPASSSISAATLALYQDGKCHKIWGARGTGKLTLETGKPGIWHMEFTGADFSVTDVALLSSGVTYNAIIPPAFQGATLTIDSYAALIGKMELDLGNAIALRPDAASSSGHKSAVITNRAPSLSFDPEDVLVATKDFFGAWRAGTEVALSCSIGASAGNRHAITAPKVQYQAIGTGDKNGIASLDIKAQLDMSTGDDEWQWAIT